MDLPDILIKEIGSGVLTGIATDAVKSFLKTAFNFNSSLEDRLKLAKNRSDVEDILRDSAGVIDACADQDTIDLHGGILTAVRAIRLSHANGKVAVSRSTVQAPILVSGGSSGSTGLTIIGEDTEFKSRGTSMKIGRGCSLKITGSARITQT